MGMDEARRSGERSLLVGTFAMALDRAERLVLPSVKGDLLRRDAVYEKSSANAMVCSVRRNHSRADSSLTDDGR